MSSLVRRDLDSQQETFGCELHPEELGRKQDTREIIDLHYIINLIYLQKLKITVLNRVFSV